MEANPLRGKALAAFRLSTAAIVAYEGSVRSGKTFTTLLKWIDYCRRGPEGLLLITGRTERTVINNIVLPIMDMLGRDRVKLNRGEGRVNIAGRDCLLIGANNEQARTKIQGLTLAGAYVDEASTLPESYFNMLFSRLSVEGAQLFLTANPEGPQHWLLVNWLQRAKLWLKGDGTLEESNDPAALDLVRFTFILDDNAHNLPTSYVENLKRSYTGVWHRRFIQAQWVVADGTIYDSWTDDLLVDPVDLPPMERVLSIGVDYGTTNATAGLILGLADQRLWLLDEWAPKSSAGRSLTDAEQSLDLRRWLPNRPVDAWRRPEWIHVDPAAASFRLQLFSDGLSNTVPAWNDVLPGIRTVASLMATGRLRVSKACTNFRTEVVGYSWDPKATKRGEDAPLKVNDHFVDSARYAIASTSPMWKRSIPILTAETLKEAA